jgi:hypothetical protein
VHTSWEQPPSGAEHESDLIAIVAGPVVSLSCGYFEWSLHWPDPTALGLTFRAIRDEIEGRVGELAHDSST